MTPLQAAILPPSAGWSWILQGYFLFRRQPMAMLFWSIVTSFFINVGALIPVLGQTVLVLLTPLLTFLTLCACRKLEEGVRIVPGLWLQPLQTPGATGAQLRLGLAYLGCSFIAALAAVLPFLSSMLDALGTAEQPDFAALSQAMQRRAARVGFDWKEIEGVMDKLSEEVRELQESATHEERAREFGDVLLALVNVARWMNVESEEALQKASRRFERRFRHMEEDCRRRGISLAGLPLAEQDRLWEQAKEQMSE